MFRPWKLMSWGSLLLPLGYRDIAITQFSVPPVPLKSKSYKQDRTESEMAQESWVTELTQKWCSVVDFQRTTN